MTSPTDSTVDSDSEKQSRRPSRRELRRQWQREQESVEGAPKSIFDLEYVPPTRPYIQPVHEEDSLVEPEAVDAEAIEPQVESEVEPEIEPVRVDEPVLEPVLASEPRVEAMPTRVTPPPAQRASAVSPMPPILFQRIPEEDFQVETEQSDISLPDAEGAAESSPRRKPLAAALGIAAVFGVMLTLALPAIDFVTAENASADSGQVLNAGAADETRIDLESFESVDELQAAAEAALTRADTFVNDATATVQYPFPFGVPLTDGFGPRSFPVSGFHDAQDFGAGYGGAVQSIADGTVIESGTTSDGCGFGLKIRHRIDGQNVESRYCHLATAPVVAVGDQVRVGQFVALVGSSGIAFGAHLHFVINVNGKAVDPMPFLAKYNRPRSEW